MKRAGDYANESLIGQDQRLRRKDTYVGRHGKFTSRVLSYSSYSRGSLCIAESVTPLLVISHDPP